MVFAKKHCPGFLIICLMILCLALESKAADQDIFSIYPLEVEGEIHGYVSADINGNHLSDIVIVYSPADDHSTRYAGLFLQIDKAGFNLRPDYLIRLPQTAVQIDAGDVDDDGIDEILLVDADGVVVMNYNSGIGLSQPVRLIRRETIYSLPIFQGIINEPFLFEINSSSGPEIIIPTPKGYAIFERGDEGSYGILNQLEAAINCQRQGKGLKEFAGQISPVFTVGLARVNTGDCNLDGRKDLYFLWDKKACCFIQDNTGNYSQTPDVELNFFNDDPSGYTQSWLGDFNNDGRPDIAVSHTSGGMTNAETYLRFYLCNSDGRPGSSFNKEIRLSDSHCNLMINDYNRDNRPELIVPALELGSIAATKMFLLKKADLHLLIYSVAGGLPVDEPTARKKFEFRFNFDHPQPTREVAVNWEKDINGDNLLDMVYSDGNGHLRFYWGNVDDFLSKKPDLEISLDHPEKIMSVQLNSGTRSDLIIEHNLTGKVDRLTVLKNRGNGI